MKIPQNLNWNLSPREAAEQQREMAGRVIKHNEFGPIHQVAGVDVGFEEQKTVARAAAVVLSFPALDPVEDGVARRPVTFPYIPGLLAYREMPVVLDALSRLGSEPEVIVVDGHGYAHPRRFGIACQVGVWLDRTSIGFAKSVLVGTAQEPANRVGATSPLIDKGETIGMAVRTRVDTRPVYVSIGNKIDLDTAVEIVLKCTTRYRIPEPIRYAHNVAAGRTIGEI